MKSILASVVFTALVGAVAAAEDKPKPPAVGDVPPALEIQTLLQAPDGAHASWNALKGKVVVLEFWATWCGPCVGAISHMNELEDAFKDRDVQFIAITDEDEPTITEFLTKKPIHGWVGLNGDKSMLKSYAVRGIPHTVIVGADGKIAAVTYPMTLQAANLEKVLAGKESGLPEASPIDQPQVPVGEIPDADKAEASPVFQIVIRPSRGGQYGMNSGGAGKNQFGNIYGSTMHGFTVEGILLNAYDVPKSRLFIEAPLPKGAFDVFIKLPAARESMLDPMLQQAAEATFGLSNKHESRDMEAYALTVKSTDAKGLKPTATPKTSSMMGALGSMSCVNMPISSLARNLEHLLQKPVIDETGLKGGYDIEFRWDQTLVKPPDPATLIAAAAEQLGLGLTLVTRPIDVVVISPQGKASKSTPVSSAK